MWRGLLLEGWKEKLELVSEEVELLALVLEKIGVVGEVTRQLVKGSIDLAEFMGDEGKVEGSDKGGWRLEGQRNLGLWVSKLKKTEELKLEGMNG